MVILRILLMPLRLLPYCWYTIRNLFKHPRALFHRIPDHFTFQRQTGLLNLFLSQEQTNYAEYLIFLNSVQENDLVRKLVYYVPEMNCDWSEVEEIGIRLEKLREKGLELCACSEGGNIKSLYLMSFATQRIAAPYSQYTVTFPASESFFVKDALKKFGVQVETFTAGKFKSAGEIFTRSGHSDPSRKALTELMRDLKSVILSGFQNTQNISPAALKKTLKLFQSQILVTSEELKSLGFLEALVSEYDINEYTSTGNVTDPAKPEDAPSDLKPFADEFQVFSRIMRKKFPLIRFRKPPRMAYLAMSGNIIMGKPSDTPRPEVISAQAYRKVLQGLRETNESAVVIHINSPGGSAAASELLYQDIRKLREIKPVFILFGAVAASGGYYIACGGDRIYGPRSCLTGSIGVLSMHVNMQKFYQKYGIKKERLEFGPTMDMLSEARPLSPASRALMKKTLSESYTRFLEIVAGNRSRSVPSAEKFAGGRVWSGERFLKENMMDANLDLIGVIDQFKEEAGMSPDQPMDLVFYPDIKTDFRSLINEISPTGIKTQAPLDIQNLAGKLLNLEQNLTKMGKNTPLHYAPIDLMYPELNRSRESE